ncbi:serine/threonine protein kinase [Labilithrix luteola]|uniref:Serine/threonine protein kinase n=1 Tax=Labilithrix luteola TaxID=1391654 RepID=A0A0K1PXI2_9BACT|nr:serine/threonine-protein kinase [Labilithrix luteola]AKU98212.1 serine/threonine protein kinase [Labilithrix luteola]
MDGHLLDSVLAVAPTVTPTVGPRSEVILDLVGRKLGKYVVRELIGQGGMATVWSAVHEELGGVVAIKLLDARLLDGDAPERFLREARVSAQLNHDHVVKVIDFARDPEFGSYIIMERLTGHPLDRVLASQGPLEERRVIALAMQIADALGAAHEAGIVHRDLKPGNVFLTRALGTEVVKVVDFGIAGVSAERTTLLTRSGAMFGTPLYMSPEQWDGVQVGPASDIYSLGVVMFEMLTGRLPIAAGALTEMAKKVALMEAPSMLTVRPDLSPELDAIVLRCLRKHRSERFASMRELAEALRNVGAPRTSRVPPAASIPAPARIAPVEKNHKLVVATVGGLIALVALLAIGLTGLHRSKPTESAPTQGFGLAPTPPTTPLSTSPPTTASSEVTPPPTISASVPPALATTPPPAKPNVAAAAAAPTSKPASKTKANGTSTAGIYTEKW